MSYVFSTKKQLVGKKICSLVRWEPNIRCILTPFFSHGTHPLQRSTYPPSPHPRLRVLCMSELRVLVCSMSKKTARRVTLGVRGGSRYAESGGGLCGNHNNNHHHDDEEDAGDVYSINTMRNKPRSSVQILLHSDSFAVPGTVCLRIPLKHSKWLWYSGEAWPEISSSLNKQPRPWF